MPLIAGVSLDERQPLRQVCVSVVSRDVVDDTVAVSRWCPGDISRRRIDDIVCVKVDGLMCEEILEGGRNAGC